MGTAKRPAGSVAYRPRPRKYFRMKRIFTIVVPLLAILALIGWRIGQQKAETRKQAQQQQARGKTPLTVDVAKAMRRDLVRTYEAVGGIETPTAVPVAPRITGRVTFLNVREGDRVMPGQVLARIDTAEVDALIAQKQASLAQARDRLAQAQATAGANTVGIQSAVQTQTAAVTTARARIAQVRADTNARIAAANAAVTQAKGRVTAADAQIKSADATITTAQASLANAETELNRQETLLKEGATAQQVVDNARTARDVQRGEVDKAVQGRAEAVAARQSAVAEQNAATQNVQIVKEQARADQAAANAATTQARAALQTAVANRAQTPAYQSNLRALQGAVTAAQADVQATQAQRTYAELRSPISGVVTARNAELGTLASAGTPVLSLATVSSVFAVVAVPEDIAAAIKPGQTARVAVDGVTGGQTSGRVERVFPSADPQSRQFTVRVALANVRNQLRPGVFARVTFTTSRIANALVIPREAVKTARSGGNGESGANQNGAASTSGGTGSNTNEPSATGGNQPEQTVAIVDNKTARVVPVKTGANDDKFIQILSGLNEGDSVVILAGRDIKDGQPVQIAGGNDRGKELPQSQAGANSGKQSQPSTAK